MTRSFSSFPYKRYAADVTFQQPQRPSGSIQKGKVYLRGKQKLYGYRVEISVLPVGLAINYTAHYLGSVSDLERFQKIGHFIKLLQKDEAKNENEYLGVLSEEYPENWGIILEKRYEGFQEFYRGVHLVKLPARGHLSQSQLRFNLKFSRDRSIVEIYFGRVCLLSAVMSKNWR